MMYLIAVIAYFGVGALIFTTLVVFDMWAGGPLVTFWLYVPLFFYIVFLWPVAVYGAIREYYGP